MFVFNKELRTIREINFSWYNLLKNIEFEEHYKYKGRPDNDDSDDNYDVGADDVLPI